MRSGLTCTILGGAASLVACANTQFVSTWKAPDAESLKGEGSKVVAVAMMQNESTRRSAEDALAREITQRGAQGIPGYTLIQDEATPDEPKAKEAMEKAGVAVIVVMRPTAVGREVTASPVGRGSYYGGYWGGYYGYGWQAAYGPAVEIRTDTIVYVETLVYSMKQNKLVWSAQSKTTNPSNVDSLVREVVNAAAREMKKEGLI